MAPQVPYPSSYFLLGSGADELTMTNLPKTWSPLSRLCLVIEICALVKAVLLAGASHLRGNVENQNDQHGGLPLEEAPSGKQGFGRVDLSQALPLQGSGKNWRLQVRRAATVPAAFNIV
eukprot:scaffold81342_cov17-Tisochrysis_lutea.AAC.4